VKHANAIDQKGASAHSMQKDPVCGMTVEPSNTAAVHKHQGKTYYFCGASCAQKFQIDPKRYVAESHAQLVPSVTNGEDYTCPMHPDVRKKGPGNCPKCGMALEPVAPTRLTHRVEYTCPMHPEIVRSEPGNCPICGMALEPREISTRDEESPELAEMRRRFWVSLVLTVPLLIAAMGDAIPGGPLKQLASQRTWTWVELILGTPVVLWGGWPFFVRAWQSIMNRSLNMFTLIGLGVAVAYVYSLFAALAPGIFPPSFRDRTGHVGVYFEAAAVIVTLVLLGQVLELKARSQTGAAIKAPLGLAPKPARLVPTGKRTGRCKAARAAWRESACGRRCGGRH